MSYLRGYCTWDSFATVILSVRKIVGSYRIVIFKVPWGNILKRLAVAHRELERGQTNVRTHTGTSFRANVCVTEAYQRIAKRFDDLIKPKGCKSPCISAASSLLCSSLLQLHVNLGSDLYRHSAAHLTFAFGMLFHHLQRTLTDQSEKIVFYDEKKFFCLLNSQLFGFYTLLLGIKYCLTKELSMPLQ